MVCDVCQKEINEPSHIYVSAVVVKHDESFQGGLAFSSEEKNSLNTNLQMHRSCWFKLITVKQGKKLEVI